MVNYSEPKMCDQTLSDRSTYNLQSISTIPQRKDLVHKTTSDSRIFATRWRDIAVFGILLDSSSSGFMNQESQKTYIAM